MNKLKIIVSFLLLVTAACGTSERTTDEDDSERTGDTEQPIFDIDPGYVKAYLVEEMTESERLLFENRSNLSDQFAMVEHDMPDVYLKDITYEEQITDEYAGYRVQLLSTRSVADADSTKDNFRAWAEENIEGYTPEAYVIFRQPYYKVRVGDFRNQQKANQFSRLIKDEFPGAWVVHDRIEPEYMPADTTEISKIEM